MNDIIKNNDLTLRIHESEKDITVYWEGRSTERDPSIFLSPIFNGIIEKNKKIILNFKGFEFMNSSTITPLLKLMDHISNNNGEILILYNKDLRWQEMSFSALEIFKTKNHRINIIGE